MFGDKQHGLGKQVLGIAICECQGDEFAAQKYFVLSSNVELTMELAEAFTETTARDYFG